MESAEKVAWLALVYREFEAGSRGKETSLLKKMASDQLNELDALIVDAMTKLDELSVLMVELAGFDALRYEELLHAWPPGPNNDPPPEEGSDRALFTPDRWREVEDAMRALYATGITHSRDFVNVIADEAYAAARIS